MHNWNQFASVSVGYSIKLKENYKDLKLILKKIRYVNRGQMICADSKVLNTLFDQQLDYTKSPRYSLKEKTPPRKVIIHGESRFTNVSLVPLEKILLPTFHIKLRLMKQFCKFLRKNGKCWKALCLKFLMLSVTKL